MNHTQHVRQNILFNKILHIFVRMFQVNSSHLIQPIFFSKLNFFFICTISHRMNRKCFPIKLIFCNWLCIRDDRRYTEQKNICRCMLVKHNSKIQLESLTNPVFGYSFCIQLTTDTPLYFEMTILLKFHNLYFFCVKTVLCDA